MAKILKINHIAVAMPELENAIPFWQDQLGLALHHVEDVPSQQSKVAFLPVGESEVEIVSPTSEESGMAKYIEKRGPGLHHICFEVDNIDEMLEELKVKGVRLIDETAKALPGRKMAFIHPKSSNGVLVELYEVIKE